MISAPWQEQRLLIPRWRRLAITAATSELATPREQEESVDVGHRLTDFDEKLSRWRESRTLVAAAEIVGAALVEARGVGGSRPCTAAYGAWLHCNSLATETCGAIYRKGSTTPAFA